MVIYDQRTAISVTRLSANAFLIFSLSLSSLLLFIGLLQNLHTYTPASTILGVFPPWRRPFRKHTKPGRICTDICCSGEGKVFTPTLGVVFSSDTQKVLKTAHKYLLLCFSGDICCSAGERTVQSKAVKWALTTKCATPPPSALLWGEKCPMSVWPTIRKVSPCVLALWLHCDPCCALQPIGCMEKKHFWSPP